MTRFTVIADITPNLYMWEQQGYGVDTLTSANLQKYLLYTLDLASGEGSEVTVVQFGDWYTVAAVFTAHSPTVELGFGDRTDKQEATSVFRHAVADFAKISSFKISHYVAPVE